MLGLSSVSFWLHRLGTWWRGRSLPARPSRRPRPSSAPRLEPLETRVNPSNLFGRLTSPPAPSYLSTSSIVLTDTIGQVEGAGDTSPHVAQVLGRLNQLQGNLDNLLNVLDSDQVPASKQLRGDLLNLVHEADFLMRELRHGHGGDVPVAVPAPPPSSLSLQAILKDVRFAIHSLATGQPLSKLPCVNDVFALEAGLPNVPQPPC
jgi:hypothetical protein